MGKILRFQDLDPVEDGEVKKLLRESEEMHKLIHGLMRYLRNTNSEIRGTNS